MSYGTAVIIIEPLLQREAATYTKYVSLIKNVAVITKCIDY